MSVSLSYRTVAAPLSLLCAPLATAAQGDLRAERQATLNMLLTTATEADLTRDRAACASGSKPASIARSRSLGATGLPDAADYCITVLIRLARMGRLSPLRDSRDSGLTAALALDAGFAAAYTAGQAGAALPTMDALRPIAERCLAQREPNNRLCYSTGYAFGVRARRGETVRIP